MRKSSFYRAGNLGLKARNPLEIKRIEPSAAPSRNTNCTVKSELSLTSGDRIRLSAEFLAGSRVGRTSGGQYNKRRKARVNRLSHMLLEDDHAEAFRVGTGLTRGDSDYFTNASGSEHRSRFREDVRAIVGGALALAFLAAALANLVPNSFISDGLMTAIAALAGGIGGKIFLV